MFCDVLIFLMMEEVRTTSKGCESKERMTPAFKLLKEARDF
jgi:predicted peroxiredoxin